MPLRPMTLPFKRAPAPTVGAMTTNPQDESNHPAVATPFGQSGRFVVICYAPRFQRPEEGAAHPTRNPRLEVRKMGAVPEAGAAAGARRIIVERPAPHHTVGIFCQVLPAIVGAIGIVLVLAAAPFPHVPGHLRRAARAITAGEYLPTGVVVPMPDSDVLHWLCRTYRPTGTSASSRLAPMTQHSLEQPLSPCFLVSSSHSPQLAAFSHSASVNSRMPAQSA